MLTSVATSSRAASRGKPRLATYTLVLVGLAVVMASLHRASPARACSYEERLWALPTMESHVPTNTRVWFYFESPGDVENLPRDMFELRDANDALVPVDFKYIPLAGSLYRRALYVLTPRDPLVKGGAYRARGSDSLTGFVVDRAADHEPPKNAKAIARTESRGPEGSTCGAWAVVRFLYELDQPTDELLASVLDGYQHFDTERLSGTLFDAVTHASHSYESKDEQWMGDGALLSYGTEFVAGWPESNPKSVKTRVGTFDLAGNFSGWSEPLAVELPSRPGEGGGCALTASRRGASVRLPWYVAAFGWVVLARGLRSDGRMRA